jgi:hypothetical protein
LARHEFEPDAPLALQRIEEVFGRRKGEAYIYFTQPDPLARAFMRPQ